MAQDSKSRKLDQYIVRFPDGMRDRIKAAADANNRSMNAEIVARLESSFDGDKDQPDLAEAHRVIQNLLLALEYAKKGNQTELLETSERDGFLFLSGVPTKWMDELRLWERAENKINWNKIQDFQRGNEIHEYICQNKVRAIYQLINYIEKHGYAMHTLGFDGES